MAIAKQRHGGLAAGLGLGLALSGCILDSQEAERIELPTVIDGADATLAVTDRGYEVELTQARFAVRDLQFTTQGEQSTASGGGRLSAVFGFELGESLLRSAHAHPGHLEGGEVIGELPGRHVFDWIGDDGVRLGQGTFLTAQYDSVNFEFIRAGEDDVAADDPLFGHSVRLEGVARRDDEAWPFIATIDQDEGRAMIGGPFQARVRIESEGPVQISMRLFDPVEGGTVFDGVDFAALGGPGDVLDIAAVGSGPINTTHNRIRNALQRHPFYGARLDG